MVERKDNFKVKVDEWAEISVTGDINCPRCKSEMFIIYSQFAYAYCSACGSYWMDKTELDALQKLDTADGGKIIEGQ